MWRIWQLEASLAVLFFLLLVPILLAPFLHRIYGRYGRFAGGPAFLAMAAGLYGCALVAFTLFPLPDADGLVCTRGSLSEYWQLDPLESARTIAVAIGERGVVAGLTSSASLQAVMNIVFFLPLGFLAAYRVRASLGRTLVVGFVVSLAIETTQGTANWGLYTCPYRQLDVADLIYNTLGAGAGWLIGMAVGRAAPFTDLEPVPDTDAPTIRRRIGATLGDLVVVSLVQLVAAVTILVPMVVAGAATGDALGVATALELAAAFGLLVLMPALRQDRATPGAWATWLGQARAGSAVPAPRRALLVIFLVRWLPSMATGIPFLLPLTFIVEALTVLIRRDHRSLSLVIARTDTATRRAMEIPPAR
jgi:glycopeptide antibiotics resistance protein